MSYGSVGGGSSDAKQKVNAPALALIISASIFSVLHLITFFTAPTALKGIVTWAQDQQAKAGQPVTPMPDPTQGPLDYAVLLLGLAGGGFVIYGALQMRELRSFGIAMAASIVAMIPYISPSCNCCFGIPFGIWALVHCHSSIDGSNADACRPWTLLRSVANHQSTCDRALVILNKPEVKSAFTS